MKNKITISAIFILTFTFMSSLFAQNKIAHYKQVSFFLDYEGAIKIGLLKIEGGENFGKILWDSLKQADGWREKFNIYPLTTLESLKEDFEIESLDPADKNILHKLNEELNIDIIFTGRETLGEKIEINLIKTITGDTLFTNIYMPSNNSTPLKDILQLFNEQKTTEYRTKIKNPPEMVLVEKGAIEIKPTRYNPDSLIVDRDFYISKYECTIKQFAEFIEATGYKTDAEKEGFSIIYYDNQNDRKDSTATWQCDENGKIRPDYINAEYPVIHISWNDAVKYCEWLSDETGDKYRLPTLAEWQFASVGGINSENLIYSGNNNLDEVGWFKDNSKGLVHFVGEKIPNELGIYDMSGNVREWCLDQFMEDEARKMVANGSWLDQKEFCITSSKLRWEQNYRSNIIGFRVIKEVQ